MKYPMYAIRDCKTTFFPPQCEQNESTAVRNFGMMIQNSDGIIGYAPNDFDLYKVGEFDSEKGTVTGKTPRLVCSGNDMVGVKIEK